jgi:hypothetical protein
LPSLLLRSSAQPEQSTSNTKVAFGGITLPAPRRAVAQMRRDGQLPAAADLHAGDGVPTGDAMAATQPKIEGLPPVYAAEH